VSDEEPGVPERPDGLQLPDLGGLLEQAGQMQQQLAAAQAEAEDTVVEGSAGGGAVRVSVTGGSEFRSVTIQPGAVDPDDLSLLEDLVLAAVNDAMAQVAELQRSAAASVDLGGIDLGGLLGGSETGGPETGEPE
jgi:nucleoid-associated protein EbfC